MCGLCRLTSLCSWDASLACSVSRVSGSVEYSEDDASFMPCLYFIWKLQQQKRKKKR